MLPAGAQPARRHLSIAPAPQIVRGLNDKTYEKRKAAAVEVERYDPARGRHVRPAPLTAAVTSSAKAPHDRIVREANANKNTKQILAIIKFLVDDFAYSINTNSRKGGLIGLAATAVALSNVRTGSAARRVHCASPVHPSPHPIPVVASCPRDTPGRTATSTCQRWCRPSWRASPTRMARSATWPARPCTTSPRRAASTCSASSTKSLTASARCRGTSPTWAPTAPLLAY